MTSVEERNVAVGEEIDDEEMGISAVEGVSLGRNPERDPDSRRPRFVEIVDVFCFDEVAEDCEVELVVVLEVAARVALHPQRRRRMRSTA